MAKNQEQKFWSDVISETRARVALHILCQEIERSYNYSADEAIRRANAPVNYTKARIQTREFQDALERARERYWFNLYGAGELERDDEYFEVITRNGGLGVSLTGDYWKRYRRILAWKLSGEDVPPDWAKLFCFNASNTNKKGTPVKAQRRAYR